MTVKASGTKRQSAASTQMSSAEGPAAAAVATQRMPSTAVT